MIAQRAGKQNGVSGLAVRARKLDAGRHQAHACCVDVNAVAVSAIHDFRVARYHMHAGLGSDFANRFANAAQVIHGEALFEHHGDREVFHLGAARGNVVHRAANGQTADVAAGEEMRRDHERVGGKRQALAGGGGGQKRRVVALGKFFRAIGRGEHVVDDALHHGSAGAMTQKNSFVSHYENSLHRVMSVDPSSNSGIRWATSVVPRGGAATTCPLGYRPLCGLCAALRFPVLEEIEKPSMSKRPLREEPPAIIMVSNT